MRTTRHALPLLLALAAGAAGGWLVARSTSTPPAPDDTRHAAPPAAPSPATAPAAPEASSPAAPRLGCAETSPPEAELKAELARLRAALAQAEHERDALKAASPAAREARNPATFRFGLAGETPRFDAADWPALAKNVRGLSDLMPRMAEGLSKGEPDTGLMQEAGELNMPLAAFAISTAKELGGTGPNGAFTHPAVLANLLRAALAAAGLPLSEAQEQSLAQLGEAWVRDDAAARAATPPGSPALAGLIAEVEAKAHFMDGAKALLTFPQRSALFHPQTEGRASLDLFSPALVYAQRVPALGTQPAEAHVAALRFLLAPMGLNPEQRGAYTDAAARWLDDTPWRQRTLAGGDPDLAFPLLSDLQAFARAQLTAMQRILDQGLPTPEQATRLRASLTLVMPALSVPKDR